MLNSTNLNNKTLLNDKKIMTSNVKNQKAKLRYLETKSTPEKAFATNYLKNMPSSSASSCNSSHGKRGQKAKHNARSRLHGVTR